MDRVLGRFYQCRDYTTKDSWCVMEHTDWLVGNLVKTNLTEQEAIDLAIMLNEEYESEKI